MGKLIELLNEYGKSGLNEFELEKYEEWWYCEWNGKILRGNWENNNELTPYELCSKKFLFIKRLVDNDKIELKAGPLYGFQPIMSNRQPFTLYETLLMLLSIQDNPIEFLISVLK